MIPVTKPFLPPKQEYDSLVDEIWNRNWLTNNGPIINQLELSLKEQLSVGHFLVVLNGTIALQLAFKALGLKGKYISTPFSYVATVSAAVWEGLNPVFADVDPDTFNIDPDKLETLIDDEVCCIVATHVFGNPCDVEKLDAIGAKYNIPIIYDAAHAFGVTVNGKGIAEYGDVSTFSFHATKLYHMIEGGGIAANDPEVIRKAAMARNFGHRGAGFDGVGINGKTSEFHAAMGLANLNYVDEIIARRKHICDLYDQIFEENKVNLKRQKIMEGTAYNYAYYPVLFESTEMLEKVVKELEGNYINPRRYFYPSLNELPYVNAQEVPVSESLAGKILCLPLYHDLTDTDVGYITRIIIRTLKY